MLNPREYCFWCMSKLPSANGVCGSCGRENTSRKNHEGELPFAVLGSKYLVGHALGRGGFGITYVGLNMMLEKRVAIKEYFPSEIAARDADGIHVRTVSAGAEQQFEEGKQKALDEARTIARVQNVSNVVGIYDCFELNHTVYIIMEFIEGETFASYTARKGGMKWRDVWQRIRPTGTALGQMHRLDLIHRDISPDNIMIRKDNGESVLLDFGAASGTIAEGQERAMVLKDGYAAPEQYRSGAEINRRADEYSWCATIWYMLTGVRPPSALQRKTQQTEPVVPVKRRRMIPEAVRKTLLKGMAIRPENRYPTMEELILALDEAGADDSRGRKALMIAAAAMFLIMLLALAAGLIIKVS